MDRRTLLKLLAAATLAGCGQRTTRAPGVRVVVAGAGIIGASIAYQLAKAGAAVTVIDQEGPATHASRGTFAWINATWAKQPRHYHALNQEGVTSWHTLSESLALPVRWGGSLEWFEGEARTARLSEQLAEQVAWGEPARMLSAAEVSSLEPGLAIEGSARIAYSPNDGAVDPVLATNKLLDAAQRFGATLLYPSRLLDVQLTGGRLSAVETSTGTLSANRLVLATGAAADVPPLVAGIEVPQRSTPGIIAITGPLPRLLNRVVAAPGVHMHQRDDGRMVIGEQDGAPEGAAHALRLEGRPNNFPSEAIARQHGDRMLEVVRRFLPAAAAAKVEAAYIGWRPLPVDGHPVLGASPVRRDVYLAIMHSGVSLAPVVGQLVAHELLEQDALERLGPYRPDRQFEEVRRY